MPPRHWARKALTSGTAAQFSLRKRGRSTWQGHAPRLLHSGSPRRCRSRVTAYGATGQQRQQSTPIMLASVASLGSVPVLATTQSESAWHSGGSGLGVTTPGPAEATGRWASAGPASVVETEGLAHPASMTHATATARPTARGVFRMVCIFTDSPQIHG
jgi:hypothetical protein